MNFRVHIAHSIINQMQKDGMEVRDLLDFSIFSYLLTGMMCC